MCCPYPLLPSHQCLLSCDAILSAPICLHCVTLPPPVWEPWSAKQAWPKWGQLTRKVGGRNMKDGGVGLIEKERIGQGKEGGIQGKEREREWKRSQSSPNPDQRAVSLILQIQQSACLWVFPVADKKERKNTRGSTALKWCYFYFFRKAKSETPCCEYAQGLGKIRRTSTEEKGERCILIEPSRQERQKGLHGQPYV